MTETEFRTLYKQYRDPLFRFGFRLTGSAPVAEDLVHDCFVGLFRGGFDSRLASMKTYLYGAMRNLCRKHYRDTGYEEPDGEQDRPLPAGVLESLISGETVERVRRAVEALPLLQARGARAVRV